MSELERIFKENGGYFGEVRLGDIFESSNWNFDIKKEHINWKWDFVITAWLTDNWILWKTDVDAKVFQKNTITIDMFWFPFFRNFPYKMVTHARVFSLKANFEMTEWVWLYLASSMHFLNKKFWYSNMCSWAKIQNEKITLPLDKNGNIAFDYMEKYIRFLEAERIEELEAERIEELEAYLLATGLKDYNLNDREKSALERFENAEGIIYEKYFLKDIFESENWNFDIKKEHINWKWNFVVTAWLWNWWILWKTDVEAKIFTKNTITVDMFWENFYRNFDYKMVTHARVFSLKSKKNLSKHQMIFFSAILKFLNQIFWYENMCSYAKIKNFEISIPTLDWKIDFEFMENFIKAVEKLVIKDLVIWNEKKIKAYRDVIAN